MSDAKDAYVDRLTREWLLEERKFWADQVKTNTPLDIGIRLRMATCDLALSALSQEAARDEVLEEAARIADALTCKWHTDYKIGHGPHRASAHREGMSDGAEEVSREIRALKREPNAAGWNEKGIADIGVLPGEVDATAGPAPAAPNRKDWPTPTTANGPISRMPAPAASVAEMVKEFEAWWSNNGWETHSAHSKAVARTVWNAALLAKLGQGWGAGEREVADKRLQYVERSCALRFRQRSDECRALYLLFQWKGGLESSSRRDSKSHPLDAPPTRARSLR